MAVTLPGQDQNLVPWSMVQRPFLGDCECVLGPSQQAKCTKTPASAPSHAQTPAMLSSPPLASVFQLSLHQAT